MKPTSDADKLDLFARQALARLASAYSHPGRIKPLEGDVRRFEQLHEHFDRSDKWPSTFATSGGKSSGSQS